MFHPYGHDINMIITSIKLFEMFNGKVVFPWPCYLERAKILCIKWEGNQDIPRGLQTEISFSLYCKNCETSQNLNGEILVHTANRHEMITTIDLERFMTLDRLKFFPLSKNSVDNNSDVDMIELELKPLFPDQKLPISNAYIRYCLK